MNGFLLAIAVFLLLTLVAGMVRVVRGPTAADRMLAAQLFGTTGAAILLLLALAGKTTALLDVTLVFALLAAVVGVAFANRGARFQRPQGEDHERR
jgi:multicomponent Na+:H+ antiporter subunit F